ncbi:MAG: radical SAM protein [Clostridia bacterium]|nr:radical SAM protein [Clostridia bacterium]
MVEIQKKSAFLSALVSQQKRDKNKKYRPLYFTEWVPDEDGVLIYNNFTKQLILLTNDEFSALKDSNYAEPSELVEFLIQNYFLVPDDHNDIALVDQTVFLFRQLPRKKEIYNYTIFTTTACNARCFYCFEAGAPVYTMDEKTANDVADFILKNHGDHKVSFRWFGGEPLCNWRAIDIICARLREKGVKYQSDIVTNAYLFDKEMVQRAKKDWRLYAAQITLDGCRDTYNRVKNYKNGDMNAFDRVCDNIEELLKNGIATDIRLNIDNHNEDELFALVDYLNHRFGKYEKGKKFRVHAHPLYENTGYVKTVHDDMERQALTEKFISLSEHLQKIGLYPRGELGKEVKFQHCLADDDKGIMISPQGNLGRCEHHVNDGFFASIYNFTENKPWNKYYKPIEKCKTCMAYPSCIRPTICSPENNECFDYMQYIRFHNIRTAMRNCYEDFLKNQGDMS